MLLVFVTSPKKEAKSIAKKLLEQRLCGCVNIIDSVESLFWWQGKIDKEQESLLIIKTSKGLFRELEEEVLKIHPYDVPEVISLELSQVSQPYQRWLNSQLTQR